MHRRALICVLLASPLALTGCKRQPPPSAPPKPPEVRVSLPLVRKASEGQGVIDYETFTGRTEASETALIKARVTGHVVEAPFKEGGSVKKGELLYRIDPRTYQADRDEAEA